MELTLGTPLLAAFLLGALHVLEPVHGRSIFHAILVGSSRSFWRVVRFGTAVTLSHIMTAFLLAVLAVVIGKQLGHEQLSRGAQFIGIAMALTIGLVMIINSIRRKRKEQEADCHCSCHHIEDGQTPPAVSELPTVDTVKNQTNSASTSPTWLGISGGIIPCSASIATLILAISTGNLAFGLFAMLAFGLGLGITLTIIGFLTVLASHQLSFTEMPALKRFLRFAPGVLIAGSALITLIYLFFNPAQ